MRQEIKLTRTNKRPLVFIGEEIFSGSTKRDGDTRWIVIRVFNTGASYIVGIARLTCWDGERDNYSAEKFGTSELALDHIRKEAPDLAYDALMKMVDATPQ